MGKGCEASCRTRSTMDDRGSWWDGVGVGGGVGSGRDVVTIIMVGDIVDASDGWLVVVVAEDSNRRQATKRDVSSICWGKVRTDRSKDGAWDRRKRAAHDAISSRRRTASSSSS